MKKKWTVKCPNCKCQKYKLINRSKSNGISVLELRECLNDGQRYKVEVRIDRIEILRK